jgi:predicted DsbA family dithiol-disulfide isomerase
VTVVAAAVVQEFTDPTCPFAFSAEPSRWRLRWLYGDALRLEPRMVGLAERPEDHLAQGVTPARQAAGLARLQRTHGMPIDATERPRMVGSVGACRAVVAAGRHGPPGAGDALLRRLRVLCFAGALVDEPDVIRRAAGEAGLDPDALERWLEDPSVEEALRADMAAARDPSPAALALAGKLARWDSGWRYTCPSWEVAAGEAAAAVPGFQPLAAYEVALANLLPEVERRPDPDSVDEVLAWASEPLATAEVAAVCGLDQPEAHERLAAAGARYEPVGADGYWTAAG